MAKARRGSARPPATGGLAFTELASTDPAATRRFLESAFDWTFRSRAMPQGEYLAFEILGGGAGGVRPTQPTEAPSSLSYIRVPDLDVARGQVERAGGSVILPRMDVPGMGSFFWFKVPGGPVLACWQDGPPADERKR